MKVDSYENSLVLAPMVRICTLPFRLLCQEYGANIVFSEEIVAQKLMICDRFVDEELGVVDFSHPPPSLKKRKENCVIFRTCSQEKNIVVQLGAPNSHCALKAAELISQDVHGIDLNCGCPKPFSVRNGMGACLLTKPEVIEDIIKTWNRNLNNSFSVKVRLLPTIEESVELAKRIERMGAVALTVHCRHKPDRSDKVPAKYEWLRPIVDAVNIPVIANGDVKSPADMERLREEYGVRGAMIGRAAVMNCSCFSSTAVPIFDVRRSLLRKAFEWGENVPTSTKYQLFSTYAERGDPEPQAISRARTMQEIADIMTLDSSLHTPRLRKEREAMATAQKGGPLDPAGGAGPSAQTLFADTPTPHPAELGHKRARAAPHGNGQEGEEEGESREDTVRVLKNGLEENEPAARVAHGLSDSPVVKKQKVE
eukprot:GCRY01004726.1.p1 GENE.GCRY01004726.1~~GCRY01004726.1.p1  ORF type:complete len:425 (+),score=80.51 GCRY01004726.1:191-1465(+)